MAKTLSVEQQKDVYQKLQDHLCVIFSAPCKRFAAYPFKWEEGECDISITAIIEHFGKAQQAALIASCNRMLGKKNSVCRGVGSMVQFLKACDLKRAEGGIQFEVKPQWTEGKLMDEIKSSVCAGLWDDIKTYSDFLIHCQIRFNIKPFGGTDISVVSFRAERGLPIFLMLWLLRQLDYSKVSEECGFGQVMVIGRNGLPGDGDDHNLHFSTGFIDWD